MIVTAELALEQKRLVARQRDLVQVVVQPFKSSQEVGNVKMLALGLWVFPNRVLRAPRGSWRGIERPSERPA